MPINVIHIKSALDLQINFVPLSDRPAINLHEDSTCSVTHGSDLASLLKVARLIIWDEAPMTHRYAFEAVDRTLRDLMKTVDHLLEEKPFGGKVVVFERDFRQILPVVIKGTREEIVGASLR
ncbi:unnamed protein product [Rhizophagus irregularis]|nr:unnamed protein product [Rhizophagus irregularis]